MYCKDREREIIMVSASKHCLLLLQNNIQLAEKEDVTQEAQLLSNTGAFALELKPQCTQLYKPQSQLISIYGKPIYKSIAIKQ